MIKAHTTGGMSANATGSVSSICYKADSELSLSGNLSGTYVVGATWKGVGGAGQGFLSLNLNVAHTHTYGDNTNNPETRPINYTIRVWKRTA